MINLGMESVPGPLQLVLKMTSLGIKKVAKKKLPKSRYLYVQNHSL
uniref:Uncharacterized protein n=1 Tax=Rhizophora mucronata TaxID=61149 RepID=A0A2P2PEY7_RHIMU